MIEGSRKKVGKDFVIGTRLTLASHVPGDLTLEDTKEICKGAEKWGADYILFTDGSYDAFKYCLRLIVRRWKTLALGVWIVNIFVPMYAQHDIAGTLISFFMRVIQIIARGAVMIVWTALVIIMFVAYMVAPVLVVVELLRQLAGIL